MKSILPSIKTADEFSCGEDFLARTKLLNIRKQFVRRNTDNRRANNDPIKHVVIQQTQRTAP